LLFLRLGAATTASAEWMDGLFEQHPAPPARQRRPCFIISTTKNKNSNIFIRRPENIVHMTTRTQPTTQQQHNITSTPETTWQLENPRLSTTANKNKEQ